MRTVINITAAACALLAFAVSCRRPLFVTGDEFRSAVLHTDWSAYRSTNPDGMTTWFFPLESEDNCYRFTTASVRDFPFYLPTGLYQGVVIDYSPDEYARQEFTGMDRWETALVRSLPTGTQPDSIAHLYGAPCFHETLSRTNEYTGLYEVASQPEAMALDTLDRMPVQGGEYGYYIPYKVSETYQEDISLQDFYACPVSPVWQLHIRVFIKGINYLWDLRGSVAGLAEGRYLARNCPSETPCLLEATDWSTSRTGLNEGYASLTISTFGLPAGVRPLDIRDNEPQGKEGRLKESAVIVDWRDTRLLRPEDVRLNLRFTLRDRKTILYYHFDVGERIISYDNQLLLLINLEKDSGGEGGIGDLPDLPYVETYNGTGFDADVTPWEDGGSADISL